MSDRQKSPENIIPAILDFHLLSLEAGKNLFHLLKSGEGGSLLNQHLRNEAALSIGIILPPLNIRENLALGPGDFVVKIREVMVHKGKARLPLRQDAAIAFLKERLTLIVERYAYEFLGPEELQGLLEHLRGSNPRVVQSVYPSLLSLSEIQRILQNLLREGVPIRDLMRILEVLAETAPHTRDPEMLTEYVRHAMPRTLGGLYHHGFVIKAYVLEDKIEQWISGAVRWENQVILDFNPEAGRKILKAIQRKLRPSGSPRQGAPILLVPPEIRRFVKMFTERAFPDLPVLSYNEISPEYKVKVLGTLRMEPWRDRLARLPFFSRLVRPAEEFPGDDVQKAILILNLLGPHANGVAQYLSPWEREVMSARSMLAPIPSLGRDEVLEEFLAQVQPDKGEIDPDGLMNLAAKEPATVAAALQKLWLSRLSAQEQDQVPYGFTETGGRDETSSKEKAAIFITSAARWIQDEVYRCMNLDELRELGRGMLQFPLISSEGKRRAWEQYEGILYKDEWWDPDTLVRFLRASMKNEIDEFKKRGFRHAQKVAVLLLSLPQPEADRIGNEVLNSLTKTDLLHMLGEMGQWRDYLPPETRSSVVQEFLDFASVRHDFDGHFSDEFLRMEAERIALRDPKGTVAVLRTLWLSLRDPRVVFETLAHRAPGRTARLLLAYFRSPESERFLPAQAKASCFVHAFSTDIQGGLKEKLTPDENQGLKPQSASWNMQKKVFLEFIRGYYGGEYPAPIPFLKGN